MNVMDRRLNKEKLGLGSFETSIDHQKFQLIISMAAGAPPSRPGPKEEKVVIKTPKLKGLRIKVWPDIQFSANTEEVDVMT